ncbi:MAG TPA: ECF-type sigma factor [Tepidisphaeraceae bacterium]|nr:ECF-type sigma factor [Tepidisphaeraceae bacterium]
MPQVTQILQAIDSGDPKAAGELLPLVYDELRKLAEHRMAGEACDHTLEPTALVHEAYIRLIGRQDPGWDNRGHFFAAAAQAMRRILIECARKKRRTRHGGGRGREEFPDQMPAALNDQVDLLALDEALVKLEHEDAAKAKLVHLRFFAGLSVEEAAAILQISRATADRWWSYARAFLYCEMHGGEE